MKHGLLTVNDPIARRVSSVVVDGVDVISRRVFACDDRQGWAVVAKLDERGSFQLNAEKTAVAVELLTGVVEVVVSDRGTA